MSDHLVLTICPTAGGDVDLATLRGWAIADACARWRRRGDEPVAFAALLGGDVAGDDVRAALDALAVSVDWDRSLSPADPAVTRWARRLLAQLIESGAAVQAGDGWRLKSTALHEENERRLDELEGWSRAALAGQRKLLRHVDAPPGEAAGGGELEASLSKLAAAGWSVKGDKGAEQAAPAVHFAAGDLPLASGVGWEEDDGALAPRFTVALARLLAAVDPDERDDAAAVDAALARRLPAAQTVACGDSAEALLDLRTLAKALRDAGALELADGEPLGPVLATGRLALRAVPTAADNGAPPPDPDVGGLLAEHGADVVRFALLHAAAPEKRFAGGVDVVGYAARFLDRLRVFAEPRLAAAVGDEIDAGDGLRRRLARWCDTAGARIGENYERAAPHRATRNLVGLLDRIEDFEQRVNRHRGAVEGPDREAVAVATARLVALLEPVAPQLAGDLTGTPQRQ